MDGLDSLLFALLDLRQHHAQMIVRDLHQAVKGLAEVDDQEQRARYGECEDQNGRDHDRTWFGEYAKTCENHHQPEHQHDKERQWNRIVTLREDEYPRSADFGGGLDDTGLQRGLF